jgi:general secretion pathway protein I
MLKKMRSSKGFTLMEILLALTIMGIAVAAMTRSSGSAINNYAGLRDRTLAHWEAMNQVAMLQISDEWVAPGKKTGTSKMANQEWKWEIMAKETSDPELRKIDIRIKKKNAPDDSTLASLVVFISKPH